MRKLVTYDAPIKHKPANLSVGDVVATRGTDQALRAIEAIEFTDGKVELLLATPRAGNNPSTVTLTPNAKSVVLVHGRVEEVTREPKAAKPKSTQRASAKNPAPVKRTKVDAVAQTTPAEAKPPARAKQTRVKPAPNSGLRTLIRERIQAVILAEIDAALAEALA